MIFIILWACIFAFLALYLGHIPKVKAAVKVVIRNKKLRFTFIILSLFILLISAAFIFHPSSKKNELDDGEMFKNYSIQAVYKLDTLQKIKIENIENPKPELAYILPLVINAYKQIVPKGTLPVLTQLNDTLNLEFRGFKQFKNRSIRLTKLLQKKLGNRYAIKISSNESTHKLQIIYRGNPWTNEQLLSLPIIEAAQIYDLDPALLISLARHISNFNFNYKGVKNTYGIFALSEGFGLDQVFIAAKKLSNMHKVGISNENAIASFYPDYKIGEKKENWKNSPYVKSWVNQVLGDIDFYHNNGIILQEK